MHVYICVGAVWSTPQGDHVEIRGQLVEVSVFFLPCGFWDQAVVITLDSKHLHPLAVLLALGTVFINFILPD